MPADQRALPGQLSGSLERYLEPIVLGYDGGHKSTVQFCTVLTHTSIIPVLGLELSPDKSRYRPFKVMLFFSEYRVYQALSG